MNIDELLNENLNDCQKGVNTNTDEVCKKRNKYIDELWNLKYRDEDLKRILNKKIVRPWLNSADKNVFLSYDSSIKEFIRKSITN